jgi:hypothetical protein
VIVSTNYEQEKDSVKHFGFKIKNFDNEISLLSTSSEERDAWVKDLEEMIKKDDDRWSEEEGKEYNVRVYLDDCPLFFKLGISNAFKTVTITSNTMASEVEKMVVKKICSRASQSAQIIKVCFDF